MPTVFLDLEKLPHGTRIGGERDSRPKHITAWTWNAAEEFCMRLHLSACVCLRACVCAQIIKHPDVSRHKRSLHSDASLVLLALLTDNNPSSLNVYHKLATICSTFFVYHFEYSREGTFT